MTSPSRLVFKSSSWPQLSLRQLRKYRTNDIPQHYCDNCKCKRYLPCGCKRRKQ